MARRTPTPYGAWPRGLSRALAASYTGVGETKFLAEVDAGLWPPAEVRGGRVIWDRYQLDEAWNRRQQDDGDPLMGALDDSQT